MSNATELEKAAISLSSEQKNKLDAVLNKVLVQYEKVSCPGELSQFYYYARRDLACAFWQVYEELKKDDPFDLKRYGGDIPDYMGGGNKKPEVIVTGLDNKTTPYEHPVSGGTTKTYKK